jgi:hypothetical protein
MTESEFRELVLDRIESLMNNQRMIYSTLMTLDQRLAQILAATGKIAGPTGAAYGTPNTGQSANTFNPYSTTNAVGSVPTYEMMRDATQPMLDSQLRAVQAAQAMDTARKAEEARLQKAYEAAKGKVYFEMSADGGTQVVDDGA